MPFINRNISSAFSSRIDFMATRKRNIISQNKTGCRFLLLLIENVIGQVVDRQNC